MTGFPYTQGKQNKMVKYCFLFLLTELCCFLPGKAQQNRPVTDFNTIKELVQSNRFDMEYTIATTHYTFYLQPTTPYSDQNIRINRDSAFVIVQDSLAAGYLPYFGSGYSMPQLGAKGIVFSNRMLNRTCLIRGRRKRQTILYQFSVVGTTDTYKIKIDIQQDGTCYLYVNSLYRSPISYTGKIVEKVH